jgi:propanediol dehydratase large subunit
MKPRLSSILLTLLAAAALSAALSASPAQQTFIGVITDSMCPKGDHSQMQMGATDADCTAACISVHGAEYVLYDGKDVYMLSDQRTPGKFAGKKVKVLGTLEAKSKKIQVDSITAAK